MQRRENNAFKLITIRINGRSQAVRLPKEFRFDTDKVLVNRVGDSVILSPKTGGWGPLLNASGKFTEDFMSDRKQPANADKRKSL